MDHYVNRKSRPGPHDKCPSCLSSLLHEPPVQQFMTTQAGRLPYWKRGFRCKAISG